MFRPHLTIALLLSLPAVGCSLLASQKDDTASILNPRKIHGAFDTKSKAYQAGQIPVADYYDALFLARQKYEKNASSTVTSIAPADQEFIVNYVAEGIGLVDAYCSR